MKGVDHVHIVQVRRGRLVGKVHRVLQRQVPDGKCLKLGVAGPNPPLVIMVELAEAGGHLAAAGAGGRYHHQGVGGLDIVVAPQALVADDVGHVRGISRDGIVPVAADAQGVQTLKKRVGGALAAVAGQHHAAHIQPQAAEAVNQSEHIVVIRDAQVPPHLVLFNIRGVDGDHDLHIVPELLEHPHLTVRLKARQYPGGVVVIKEFPAKLQIQLSAKLGNPLFDLFGLHGEVFEVVKTNSCHSVHIPL